MKTIFPITEDCGGCRTCETVCSWVHNEGVCNPRSACIQVVKEEKNGLMFPLTCLQCEEAYCQKVCPVNAISVDEETNAKIIDPLKCIGCRLCAVACPFGAPVFDSKTRRMNKCNLCKDFDDGPQCVKWCPKKALRYDEVENIGYNKKQATVTKIMAIVKGE